MERVVDAVGCGDGDGDLAVLVAVEGDRCALARDGVDHGVLVVVVVVLPEGIEPSSAR